MNVSNLFFLISPVIFIISLIFLSLGFVILVENFNDCPESKLWYYNLSSYILFILDIIFFMKNWFFYNDSRIDNYRNKINLLIHNVLFLSNFGLIMWGIIELSEKDCHNNIVWGYGIINLIIQIITMLIFFFIINKLLIKKNKISNVTQI